MATTKIWSVERYVGLLIDYVARTSKTTVKVASQPSEDDLLVSDILGLPPEHFKAEEKKFVSGINCTPENAVAIFSDVLRGNDSQSGITAYHGYQSFAPGEVDADTAHAIGLRLANELWGDDFPVIVATHIDRGHIHNHFALSATGFSGKRYHDCDATYWKMRNTSDQLCREFGLSVIEKPKERVKKHISEIHAEKNGFATRRRQIRDDIDAVVKSEFILKRFYSRMRELGYTFEYRGQYLRIKPDGYNKFFRLDKLGAGYSEKDIEERLRQNAINREWGVIPRYKPTLRERPKGLYALYLHYQYLLGIIPKKIPDNRAAYVALKEDVRRARMYSEEAILLGKYSINTAEDLKRRVDTVQDELAALTVARQRLRNKLRWMKDDAEKQPIRDEISKLSAQMKPLRKELKLCQDIAERSGVVEQIVTAIEFPQEKQRATPQRSGWER